jgi:hypothetical protein
MIPCRSVSAAALLLMLAVFTGCEPKEKAIVLPPAGDARPGTVVLGEKYEKQVFYDFEENAVVSVSDVASWDLAFESGKEGSHVYMNGGKGVFLYNTHQTDFAQVTDVPGAMNATNMLFDDPGGAPDSTAMRDWRGTNGESKEEVYIAKLNDTTYYKLMLLSVNSERYELRYGRIKDETPIALAIPKDDAYNFSYFSFAKGLVTPEPPKATWDVVFTRYRFIYRDINNFPYEVNGVLLNPYKVMAATDFSRTFEEITYENSNTLTYTNKRDIIGSDWKAYNFSTGRYDVKKNNSYILRTRNEKVYKLRFLDFYSAAGAKGTPVFESLQIH